MRKVIRYYQGPSFTENEWTIRNPYLELGEVGYLLDGGIVINSKVGPGRWNDLDYMGSDIYPYPDAITNPIGDVTSPVNGLAIKDIVRKMISPYVAPTITSLSNNAGGSYLSSITREIGLSVTSPVMVNFNITNEGNLSGATPINITAGSVFSNEGNFANVRPIAMSLAAPLSPSVTTIVTISVKLTHTNGITNSYNTYIRFYPKIMWFSSILSLISDSATFMAQANRQTAITNSYTRDYGFLGSGYSWVAIPTMLNPTSPVFTDVTDPNLPAGYSMEDMGTLSINNGVSTYMYRLYRSTFNLINGTTLRIA